jgi:PST family polysaccharide transporter
MKTGKNKIITNFLSLSVLQGINTFLPLLTLPYLLRILGAEMFGLVSFAQVLNQYFIIISEYGFQLSATKEVSINRQNKESLSEIVTSVILTKVFLIVLSFIILTLIVLFVPKFHNNYLVFYLSFGVVVGNSLSPVFFFQGIEDMKYITIINAIGKFLFTILIFIFVHSPSQYLRVPVINSISFIIIGLIGLFFSVHHYKLRFKFNLKHMEKLFLESFYFFLSRLSITLYTSTNTIIIGLTFSMKEVAYYNLAEKMVRLMRTPYMIFNNVVYPHVSFHRNPNFIKKVLKLTFISSVIMYIILFIFAKDIVILLGKTDYLPAANIFRILSILVIFYSIHVFLGSSTLVAFGFNKQFNNSVIFGGISYILLIMIIYFTHNLNVITIASATSAVELFILIYRYYYVKKFRILENV